MDTEAAEIRRSIEQAEADLLDVEERKLRHRTEQLQAKLKLVEAKASVLNGPISGRFADAVSARTSHRFSSPPSPSTTVHNGSNVGASAFITETLKSPNASCHHPSSNHLIVTQHTSGDTNPNETSEAILQKDSTCSATRHLPANGPLPTHLPLSSTTPFNSDSIPPVVGPPTYQHQPGPHDPPSSIGNQPHPPQTIPDIQTTRDEREDSPLGSIGSPGVARLRQQSLRSEDTHHQSTRSECSQWNTGGMDFSLGGHVFGEEDGYYPSRRLKENGLRIDDHDNDRKRVRPPERGGRVRQESTSKAKINSYNHRNHEKADDVDDEDDDGLEESEMRRVGMKRKNREDTGSGPSSEAGAAKRQNIGTNRKRTKVELAKEIADDDAAYQLKGIHRCQTCRETRRRDRDDVCIVLMDIYGKKCSSCVKHGNKCEFSTSRHSAPSNKDLPAGTSRRRIPLHTARSRIQTKKKDKRIPMSTILGELDGLISKANKVVSKAKEIRRWIEEYDTPVGEQDEEEEEEDDVDEEEDEDDDDDDDDRS